jgi:hypothetical protein
MAVGNFLSLLAVVIVEPVEEKIDAVRRYGFTLITIEIVHRL